MNYKDAELLLSPILSRAWLPTPNSIFMQILTLANHFISTIFRLIKCTKVPKLSRPRSGLRGPQGPSQCLFSGKPSPWSDHPRVSDCRPLDADIGAISVCFHLWLSFSIMISAHSCQMKIPELLLLHSLILLSKTLWVWRKISHNYSLFLLLFLKRDKATSNTTRQQ